ncbi:MAG: alkaline phosphatase family protein, partial [Gemmatimonadaceae bacterium]
HFRGDLQGWLRVDREVSANVIECVRGSHTPFVFAAFTGVDKLSHARGQRAECVLEALRILDDTVASLRSDLEDRGAWDETCLWITSDHGHSRVRHHEDLDRVIGSLGYRVLAHPWVYRLGADVAVMVSGNAMAHVYVDLAERARPFWHGMSERGRELAAHLLGHVSVDLLCVPMDAATCEVRSRTRGSATVSRSGDFYTYLPVDGDPLGIGRELHGVGATDAHDATRMTDYPDSVVQIARLSASGRAGDFILSAARDWDFRARYEPIPHVSSHGALHREHMMVPLLLNRPAARSPRRTTDVMPSALTALGIEVPQGLDGESFV